jgi:hypothetical protein
MGGKNKNLEKKKTYEKSTRSLNSSPGVIKVTKAIKRNGNASLNTLDAATLTHVPVTTDRQITTGEPFKELFCLRSTPVYKKTRSSFAGTHS